MLSADEHNALDRAGWVFLRAKTGEDPERFLLGLAAELGEAVSSRPHGGLVDRLQPLAQEKAQPRSLSRLHGTAALPFHTDNAHWPVPARHVALACIRPGLSARSTLLLPIDGLGFTQQDEAILKAGVFLVRNGRRSFYAAVLSDRQSYVRYDPGCMTPVADGGQMSQTVMEGRLTAAEPIQVEWSEGDVLIVDNWKVLHGRADGVEDSDRLLFRVLIKGQE